MGDPQWRATTRTFVDVTRPGSTEITSLLVQPAPRPSKTRTWERWVAVVSALEHHEAVAVAIKGGIIDEKIYRNWSRTRYVQAWKRVKDAVIERRQNRDTPTLYEHFQARAEKWAEPGKLD